MIYEKSLPDHSLVEWVDFLKASRGQTLVGVVAKKETFARFVTLVLTQPNVFIHVANVCIRLPQLPGICTARIVASVTKTCPPCNYQQ